MNDESAIALIADPAALTRHHSATAMNASGHPMTSQQIRSERLQPASDPADAGHYERGGVAPMIAEASRRLQAVSQRLRAFLQQELQQFEDVAVQCERIVRQRDSLLQMKDDVLRDKEEWEHQRQAQIDELRGEQDRLIEGWQKLEDEQDEQRQILARQDSMPQHAGQAPGDGLDALMPSFAATAPGAPPAPFEQKSGHVFVEPRHFRGPAVVNMSRESALDQFQRLKRDVQKHVKRLQESPCGNGNGDQ